MKEEIRRLIDDGQISALALDTSTLRAKGYAFENGLLEQVGHLRARGVTIVLPDVIKREVHRHLSESATEIMGSLNKAITEVHRHNLASAETFKGLSDAAIAACAEAEGRASRRLERWIDSASVEVVDADDYVQVGDLNALYFAGGAPFSPAGKKKSEFPDAIALLTLKGWAERNGTYVLAVAEDPDWERFGDTSSEVYVIADLGAALAAFQTNTAATICRALFKSVDDGDPFQLREKLLATLDESRDRIELSLDVHDTPYDVTPLAQTIEILGVDLPLFEHGSDEFKAVGEEDGKTVVEISATANAKITWELEFFDRNNATQGGGPIGGGSYSEEEAFEIKALVTVSVAASDRLQIEQAEIERAQVDAMLFEIKPQWYGNKTV
ncbi:PIN domain-containing protein [Paraburkholderia aspalathi]|uniref:DUF4935 domain-containing protein n=1 Tax=Paraburkholderia aspalathi TaxID=1324617 RepID=A0A1I7AB01_9BURK|nr:PIN domain-containing protein [Paraburkholderia aspalathi]SFT72126.1 hypothetical protein SAMN05192563_1003230 [Paraburkholderia aspalathi]